jgi:signal transduction histidine kinase
MPPESAAFAVFRRALASKEFAQLPPAVAAELALALVDELAPAAAGSLWILDAAGATTCLVAHGKAPRSRRLREVARAALDGVIAGSAQVHVRVVERWDRPYAALVARARGAESEHLDHYLAEAATALAPLLERASLFDRRVQREHDIVAAGERRLVRLGFDLHDGPLQEIVALAEELRVASTQISDIVPADFRQRVRGRFNDVHARLGALDESLREVAHSIRSTTAVARPVADAVESELRALENATGIEVDLEVKGNLSSLSDSQKIVLFRVVQEALSNIRKHSEAEQVSVTLRSTRTFVALTVTDNGCGFDPRRLGNDRLGLAGISERVRLLGGAVEIETSPGTGTIVRATLPQWRPSIPAAATVYAATT